MNKNPFFLYFFTPIFFISCELSTGNEVVKIQWNENIEEDFSFAQKWSYPEGVYTNEHGQLSCDGLCPPEIENMKDENGKIYADSIPSFYQKVDTTHFTHTIECEAWCYEWAGTDFFTVKRTQNDTIKGLTHTNAATHCKLIINILKYKCIPLVELNSIGDTGKKMYYLTSGNIKIDKHLLAKDSLKAVFDFTFENTDEPQKPIYWRGKILAKIQDFKP